MSACLTFPNKWKSFLLILVASVLLCLLSANWTSQSIFSYKWQCGELPYRFPDSIPPLVHWTSKDGRVPAKLIPIVRSWRRLLDVRLNDSSSADRNSSNADEFPTDRWHFMHWDDKQISELISKHYPYLVQSYRKLVNGLERSDIGRLVVLHHVGGLYIDTDVELLRDPTPLLRPSQLQGAGLTPNFDCESAVWSQEPVEHPTFIFNMNKSLISNAVMMSRANHSFLSFVLKTWPSWFERNWEKATRRSVNDAIKVTGPLMLQKFYDNYTVLKQSDRPKDWCGSMLSEQDTFQPLSDLYYGAARLKEVCSNAAKLNLLQRQYCKRLADAKFKQKQIPKSSYTVHRFLHMSYRRYFLRLTAMSEILPILKCNV
ncbi:hypothetical protein BOX15_Mlig029028g1 [Macrostomum lignano]|uniref:Alpha-1,4-N-acetylglucosaminyltransferase n=1 Tax=Macrostomum lignano TaxID=282301 RepID=A0A267ELQ1_9PLAT|nr:hypothetical protein BOX15_Mlig029028g1 [Macrostomum lignano]